MGRSVAFDKLIFEEETTVCVWGRGQGSDTWAHGPWEAISSLGKSGGGQRDGVGTLDWGIVWEGGPWVNRCTPKVHL